MDTIIYKMLYLLEIFKIPVVHAASRSKLGFAMTGKKGPRISCIAIVNP